MRPVLILLLALPAAAQTQGQRIFEAQCALCHGQTGTGGRGPGLNRPKLEKAPDDEALKRVIENGIAPEMPGSWQLHPTEVAAVAAYVRSLGSLPPEKLPGDAARGARLYEMKGCPACHMVAGKGEGFGPELTAIGAKRNGAHLSQVLRNPASLLPEGFLLVEATLLSGETVRGIRVNEDTFTVQIKDARGRFHGFRKTDLKELRKLQDETPMPSYERTLTQGERDDVVAYLAGLKGKP